MVEIINKQIQKIESNSINISDNFIEESKDAYNLVESVMKEKQIARNNDTWLMFLCWLKQGKIKKSYDKEDILIINLRDIFDLEKPSTIFRERRIIQNNENRLLPTDPKIISERRIKQKVCEEYYRK